jgi:glycerophosphoryl diester phosphodiesterase
VVAGWRRGAGPLWGGLLGLELLACATSVAAIQGPAGSVVNVAHRGGMAEGFPENTLSAFRRAISLGADAIELDLRGTKDDHVVVLHDETLDRTTNGTGRVTDHDLAELKTLDAGGGEQIPIYEEVLDLVSGTGVQLLLDIKVSPVLDRRRVVRETQEHRAVLNVIVGVRTLEDLGEFRALDPNLRVLAFVPEVEDVESFVAAGADIIRLWPRWIRKDPRLVSRVQGMGRAVWTTADDAPREELEELVASGVNGVLTDRPGVLARVLRGGDDEAEAR